MFFAKKQNFVHYWVQLNKKPNRTGTHYLNQKNNTDFFTAKYVKSKLTLNKIHSVNTFRTPEVSTMLQGRAISPQASYKIETTNYLQVIRSQIFGFNLKNNRATTAESSLFQTNASINPRLQKQHWLLTEFNNQSQLYVPNSFSVPKPWYTYWILPFLGFTALLPSLLPSSNAGQSYGFKFINIAKTKTLSNQNSLIKNQSERPVFQDVESLPISGQSISCSCSYNINKYVWIGHLPYLPQKTSQHSLFIDKIMSNYQTQSRFEASHANVLDLESNGSKGFKLNNFVIYPMHAQSNYYAHPTFDYKEIQQKLEDTIKQLLYIKDRSWFEAFSYKNKKAQVPPNGLLSDAPPTVPTLITTYLQLNNTISNIKESKLRNTQNQICFLTTSEQGLYFYQYLYRSSNNAFLYQKQGNTGIQALNLQNPTEKSYFHLKTPLLISGHNSSPQVKDYVNTSNPSSGVLFNSLQASTCSERTVRQKEKRENLQNNLTTNYRQKVDSVLIDVSKNRNMQQEVLDPSKLTSNKNLDVTLSNPSFQNYLEFIYIKLLKTLQVLNYRNLHTTPIYDKSRNMLTQSKSLKPKMITFRKGLIGVSNSTQLSFPKELRKSEEKVLRHIALSSVKGQSASLLNQRGPTERSLQLLKRNRKKTHNFNTKKVERFIQKQVINTTAEVGQYMSTISNPLDAQSTRFAYPSLTRGLSLQSFRPIDLLRIKHFIYLSNNEKRQLKYFKSLDIVLKDEKLLYETLVRHNQQQKRRKKKIKRWTRRRRKRKRKLLRPIWTTLRFVNSLNSNRLKITVGANQLINKDSEIKNQIPQQGWNSFTNYERQGNLDYAKSDYLTKSSSLQRFFVKTPRKNYQSELSGASPLLVKIQPTRFSNHQMIPPYRSKTMYTLSKKVLVELTTKKVLKQKLKTFLKRLESSQNKSCKAWLLKQGFRLGTQAWFSANAEKQSAEHMRVLQANPSTLYTINNYHHGKSIQTHLLRNLEYNRIMYERLQSFLNNSSPYIEKNLNSDGVSSLSLLRKTNNQKLNSYHVKISNTVPKEEWLWLFKYITGEIPIAPQLSSNDELRSLWAMNKLNSLNQWTGWKNFYYQEFKKGLTPVYEVWQDKKPDKRYNVNSLKKRQYKHIKQFKRLRIFPQLHKGTYFSLERDIRKLTGLGIEPYSKKVTIFPSRSNNLFSNTSFKSEQRKQIRPLENIRQKIHDLKLWSMQTYSVSNVRSSIAAGNSVTGQFQLSNPGSFNYNQVVDASRKTSSTFSGNSLAKPILDLYANWWETADGTGWGWKTIQYGAPWDRKTLYLPTKLTSTHSVINSTIENNSYHSNTFVPIALIPLSSQSTSTIALTSNVIISTLLLHICACLALFSLAEFRYSIKVQLILGYKVSSIPFKLISALSGPFITSKSNQSLLISRKIDANSKSILTNSLLNELVQLYKQNPVTPTINTAYQVNSLKTDNSIFRSLNQKESKFTYYGILQQLIKKTVRKPQSNDTQKIDHRKTTSQDKNTSVSFPDAKHSLGSSSFYVRELGKYEFQKLNLAARLSVSQASQGTTKLSYSVYYTILMLCETILDRFRESTRSIYDFFSLPENFSANPDEMGLDVIANFIYDFEEPLIELVPDTIETKSEIYLNRYLLTLNLFGPFSLIAQQRLKWFYRMFVELVYQSDADYLKDEEELQSLYTIWAEVLNKAAQELDLEASVIATQEDQRILLLEHLLVSSIFDRSNLKERQVKNQESSAGAKESLGSSLVNKSTHKISNSSLGGRARIINSLHSQKSSFPESLWNISGTASETFIKQINNNWLVDQYLLYKTDETDLFLEVNIPKSFSEIPYIKYWDTLQQPIGFITCQLFSGLLSKQMAKNILLIADQTAEKTQILQALAGETEVKLILDNSGRYSSISQSVAVGMRMLRDVFEAVALQTPCIFVLEDIHLIGEKRPFLISDEDLALVTNSGLGFEQHQLYEKIQKIQQHSKHRISYFKKPYRGDTAESLPTNLFCYELFATQFTKIASQNPNYPIPVDFHQDLAATLAVSNLDGQQREEELLTREKASVRSHLVLSDTSFSTNSSSRKVSHFVPETLWSTNSEETQQKNNTLVSLRGKVSNLAEVALGNISAKLDRITQLLVIMDNVRKNKGFIVFGTTSKPQVLDPALRRPGRLEETIYLPSIPNILSKWEILHSQLQSSHYDSFHQNPYEGAFYSSSNLPVTVDLVNFFTYSQNSGLTNTLAQSNNWVLTLAQSSARMYPIGQPSDARNSRFTRSRSLLKTTFINQLLVQIKQKQILIKNETSIPSLSQRSGSSLNQNAINETVITSYDLTGKFILEFMSKQQSAYLSLAKAQQSYRLADDDIYTRLFSPKVLFKNELITIFAGIVASYFSKIANSQGNEMKKQYSLTKKEGIANQDRSGLVVLDTTTNHNWQIATELIYAYVQKRAVYKKNTYIHKLMNRNNGSLRSFSSPPATSLLLPAKRFENYLRAERDFDHTSQSKLAITIQDKIDLHLQQRVLKRLYKLPIKEFYKSEIIEKTLTTFASATLVLPHNTRNMAKENTQAKTQFYYRNAFLNRHRHYLTTQWWTGHLTEYNIESTVMSEIDFRSIFIDKLNLVEFSGDLIIDFPDADQHYNIKQRRWFSQTTSWKGWYDIDYGLTTDIINHYVVELFTLTYHILHNNRELLDYLVVKLLVNYQLQESEILNDFSSFNS